MYLRVETTKQGNKRQWKGHEWKMVGKVRANVRGGLESKLPESDVWNKRMKVQK